MLKWIAEASPRSKARMAGVFEMFEGLTSAFGQVYVLGKLVVMGNTPATAANILGHKRLFWLGFASSLLGVAFHIAWTALFYDLFKPVNRSLSLLAAFVSLVVCAIQAVTSLFYLAPLLILQGGTSVNAHDGTIAGIGAYLSSIECLCLRHRSGVLRILVRPDGLPHLQVDLPASNSRGAIGD
jgi:hypothetical protein